VRDIAESRLRMLIGPEADVEKDRVEMVEKDQEPPMSPSFRDLPVFRDPPGAQAVERVRAAVAVHGPSLDPGRPGLRVLLLLGALAALVAAVFAWRSQPVAEPLAPPPPVGVQAALSATPSPSGGVTVYVTGKVRRPGVLTLPSGSRVTDAIQAAGGVRPGAKAGLLNLARRLVDGEQIVVGAPGGVPPAAAGGDPASGAVIDLNTATAGQLDQGLPGVGEVLARRIIEFRDAHGGFQSVDQLREVSGIGERKFAEIKDKVRA
jgi:competence protein ComEA